MRQYKRIRFFRLISVLAFCLLTVFSTAAYAQSDSDFPAVPNPPRLVNDLANVLSAAQQQALEQKLLAYNDSTSIQITIVTVQSIGGYDIAQYAVDLGNRWKVGQKGKDNGVLILAAIKDHKVNISTGYGLEGALPDALCGRIIRNEMAPSFKQNDYYTGFNNAADAIVLAAKGEYKADAQPQTGKGISTGTIIAIIVLVYFFIWIIRKIGGGGGGGGNYMSRNGRRSWGGGWIGGLGGLGGLGGGWGGGSGGGNSGGGGGFGGFGGGSFGGGGASGDW